MRLVLALIALSLSGCSELNRMRTDLSAPAPHGIALRDALIKNVTSPYDKGVFSSTYTAEEIGGFVEAGMTLSDYYCDDFFRRANSGARHRRFARNTTNDVGGMIATILGLAKAGSGVTGGAAAGFSFADSGFRNYDESFMVDADLSKMRRMVLAAQDRMRKEFYTNAPKTMFAAESSIMRYAGLCSFLGMQDLLNESVSEKTASIETQTRGTTSTSTGQTPPAAGTGTTTPAPVGTTPPPTPAGTVEPMNAAPPPPPTGQVDASGTTG